LQKDLTKRLGNLKNGATDVKDHKFFAGFEWGDCVHQTIKAPYIPKVAAMDDASHFGAYPDSNSKIIPVKPADDPFANWE